MASDLDVLALDGVTVRRGGKPIVNDVSWRVSDGERWVVLGRNGAGKTTILQLAAARMHPSEGTVDVLGERLGRVDVFELRPRVGFSSAALAERIPGDELVLDVVLTASYAMTGRWRETYDSEDTDRAMALLRAFGVDGMAQRLYGTLSEGERKRVQVARALMSDPELLLLDEPAAGLDLGAREELVGALAELAADPRSPVTILVTHHVEEIPPNFTHALLLSEGGALAAGPIGQVLTAQNLSAAFGLPLEVEAHGQRWSARASQTSQTARHGAEPS